MKRFSGLSVLLAQLALLTGSVAGGFGEGLLRAVMAGGGPGAVERFAPIRGPDDPNSA